jgi:pSer/pThr/pTyr-binding forkhead associated (FHA) protein
LELFDLGSSNGTFLNGVRLTAHKAYVIHDGDEIRFGQMALRVYFQVSLPN